jgi:5-methylcytosine-specific restriction endonuclease McrA
MATLLLNADAQPVSLLPLSTVSWEEAIKYMVLEKARVVDWYDDWIVHSENWQTRVPAILMLHEYQKPKMEVKVSRANVYLRDKFKCQYCGTSVTEKTATLDHVIPLSKGGKSNWLNLATACKPCNWRKSDKNIKPSKMPHRPDYWELANSRRNKGYNLLHPSWENYIPKPVDS